MELTAVQPQGALASLAGSGNGFLQRLWALPPGRKLTLAGGVAALIAIVVSMVLWAQDANYKLLYANVSDKDAGDIITKLSQMNVPYKFSDHGSAILVPADEVHEVRIKLASAGLPKGSVVGLEIMENPKFGITQFQERLNFQRGLEGELVRSIESLSAVQSARVHLAIPMQNGFFREQQKPSASVLLNLYAGQSLERAQIAGIVHLVASSVPDMSPKAVSVIDQTGTLLTGSGDDNSQTGLDAQQLQYVNQVEADYSKRIIDILEPMVGRDNLRAQVTAQVDFSQVDSTSEQYKPNQGGLPAAVRSEQTSESTNGAGAQPAGIPGAMSNVPPVPASAPINGASAPLQAAQSGVAGGGQMHREAVTNYEVDKTVSVTHNPAGLVKRLNAAVVINNITQTDAKGKTTTRPLTKEELDKFTALVRETIGYNADRGDSVKVINVPFHVDKTEPVDTPLLQQPEVMDLLHTLAVPGAMTVLALIVIFGAIRPAIKAVEKTAPRQLEAVVGDDDMGGRSGGVPALEAPANLQRLEDVRRMAKENPAAVANVVRNWVSRET